MVETIIKTAINYLVPLLLGYLVSRLSQLKKKNKSTNIALRTLLQNSLTNTYFVYAERKMIPDYVYKNWLNMFSSYKELGGNEYVDTLNDKMKDWNIIRTDIINK